jgi:hypothetical protein
MTVWRIQEKVQTEMAILELLVIADAGDNVTNTDTSDGARNSILSVWNAVLV